MQQFIARRWFLIVLVAVLLAGFSFPQALEPLAVSIPQKLVVAVVLFLMTLPLEARRIRDALRRPVAVMLAIGINFGLLPLVAWAASPVLRGELASGLMIAASIPCTLASAAVWTRRAGGNDAVAILVMVLTNLSCFVVTPMWLWLTTGTRVQLNVQQMMAELAIVVVLPIIAGQSLRQYRPLGQWATRHNTALGVLAQIGILSIVFIGAVMSGIELDNQTGAERITAIDWAMMIVVTGSIHLAMLATGFWLAGVLGCPREDRIAVAFSGSQKTMMIGLRIAVGYFGGLAMLPMITYHVVQLLVDTVIADQMRQGGSVADEEPPTAESL